MVSPYGVMPRFRPLSGSYISQSYPKLIILSYIYVSVPYRGATFLNIKTFQTSADSRRKFPSPIGELHFSIEEWLRTGWGDKVSVPYRGATFLNLFTTCCNNCVHLFPSPIGELHFSIPSPQPHVLSGTNRGIAGEK